MKTPQIQKSKSGGGLVRSDSARLRRAGSLWFAGLLLGAVTFTAEAQFPGFGGRGTGSTRGSTSTTGGLQAATKVTVVADEYSNSLIILAPDAYHAAISNLVAQLDVPVQDITEVRVFHLENADPVEMAAVLTSLFPDQSPSTQSDGSRGPGFLFGRGQGGRNGTATSSESDRSKKQSKVLAVADPRTSSVIVTASRDLMEQIEPMVRELDASESRKQQVFVYSLENADPYEVETVLRSLFESQSTRNNRTTQNNQQNNALTQRANNAARNQTTGNNTGFGGTGGGTGRGLTGN